MKRFPWLTLSTAFMFVVWVLLSNDYSAATLISGLLLAILLPLAAKWLRPLRAYPRHAWTACRLLGRVFYDIVESNINATKVILGSEDKRQNSAFMDIALDMRDPHGLAMLLCIITANPGTVWAGLNADGSILTLHVLDLHDREMWIHIIKDRYETLLMEIYEHAHLIELGH